jgi:YVTN family beta-propeller protein
LNAFTSFIETWEMDQDFSIDGSRIYAVGGSYDSLLVYEYGAAPDNMILISGDGQQGIVLEPLAAPLRVRVRLLSGEPVPGVAVAFAVTAGGGSFASSGRPAQIVATDADGYAKAVWVLGGLVGTQTAEAAVSGIGGSPVLFAAQGIADPATLPLTVAGINPADGTLGVSITTAIQVTFSRAVDRSTVNSSVLLRRSSDATPIPVTRGYSDGDRMVSLAPVEALNYETEYTIEINAGLTDAGAGPIENPTSTVFYTREPLVRRRLASVSPPGATTATPIMLSGEGFSTVPDEMRVIFTGTSATPLRSGVDFIEIAVPIDAMTGEIRVACGSDTTDALPFAVLEEIESPPDEVVATVYTGAPAKGVALTPDGLYAYTVCPDAGVVVPIDIENMSSLDGIVVGDFPVSIDMHPEGNIAYVANFESGSVSLIDIETNTVSQTLIVGAHPLDLAVSSDGDRIYVANAGTSDIGVIDGDYLSETYNHVIARVGTGSTTKSVAVTPDGGYLYVGTNEGYVVMNTVDYGVIARVGTGSSTKSVAVTPDGTLLILLTSEGEVLIVDVVPGSLTENQVIATVGRGSTTKSVAVTPDGSHLYLVQQETDTVIIVALEVLSSVSVVEQGTQIPPTLVNVTVVDTVEVGQNPAAVAFDPSGSGTVIVANAGDQSLSFLDTEGIPTGPVAAEIVVSPRTLALKSRGRWITGNIELPAEYAAQDIDIASVLLQDTVPALPDKWEIIDSDLDGIEELIVKFDRAFFQEIMPQGEYVPVTVTGAVGDETFAGDDTIRTIRPTVKHPAAGVVPPGQPVTVTWTSPAGYLVDYVDVHWTHDDGESWEPIAEQIPDAGSVVWHTPPEVYDSCRVLVTLYKGGEDFGMGMSPEMFMITELIAVTFGTFSGALEDDHVLLRWQTMSEAGVEGFNVLRSETEDGEYLPVTAEPVPARGGDGGSAYEYRDADVEFNITYYYQLETVGEHGTPQRFGPFAVPVIARFALAQNVPNPFNPTTTIVFSLPEKGHVNLSIYNVEGKLINTLVDETHTAGAKKVTWNGTDARGGKVSSGVYFYRLRMGKRVLTRKLIMLR